MDYLVVTTTTAHLHEARHIAHDVVTLGLAASAQISEVESFFRWQGNVQHNHEFRLVIKTTRANYKKVEAAIAERHSYHLPEIFAIPFDQYHLPYGDWIKQNSVPQQARQGDRD
jgi:periplasmic divalent cation tolerance protein